MADAAVRPSNFESWDLRELDADRRREVNDLEAIRVRFPDHA